MLVFSRVALWTVSKHQVEWKCDTLVLREVSMAVVAPSATVSRPFSSVVYLPEPWVLSIPVKTGLITRDQSRDQKLITRDQRDQFRDKFRALRAELWHCAIRLERRNYDLTEMSHQKDPQWCSSGVRVLWVFDHALITRKSYQKSEVAKKKSSNRKSEKIVSGYLDALADPKVWWKTGYWALL